MPSWASRLRDRWTDGLNEIAFRWRGAMSWSGPAWTRPVRTWERAVRELAPAGRDRADQLTRNYDLAAWPTLLTGLEVQENLYVLDLLDRHLPALPAGPGLEVGAKNGVLLPALRAVWPHPWDLVELDAHRRYLDLSTRRAHGERLARAFPGCRYIAGSVEGITERYALVTWFLPFVHEGPLRAWGLPRRFFAPERLFRHVVDRLEPDGALLVVNQGEGERDTQRALFSDAGLVAQDLGQLTSPLSPFKRPRFGQLLIRR
jgi:hypothetical protein